MPTRLSHVIIMRRYTFGINISRPRPIATIKVGTPNRLECNPITLGHRSVRNHTTRRYHRHPLCNIKMDPVSIIVHRSECTRIHRLLTIQPICDAPTYALDVPNQTGNLRRYLRRNTFEDTLDTYDAPSPSLVVPIPLQPVMFHNFQLQCLQTQSRVL